MEQVNYYKRLSCDNYIEINQELKNYITSLGLIETTKNFWNPIDVLPLFKACPKFLKWTHSNELKISAMALTVARSDYPVNPHIDTAPARFKLSWPVMNSTNSYNRWFKLNTSTPTIEINHLGGTTFLNHNELEHIETMCVDRPSLIDAGIPHDVIFKGVPVYPRVGFQCQLFNEPKLL
jgi:hypothetical protein